jgi:hypothetical protein
MRAAETRVKAADRRHKLMPTQRLSARIFQA